MTSQPEKKQMQYTNWTIYQEDNQTTKFGQLI